MNEQYLFRGKRKDNGEWVTGYYVFQRKRSGVFGQVISELDFDRHLIIDLRGNSHEVIPETVGQCTGLKDKNGKLIFEGDILKGLSYPFLSDGEYNYYAIVVWFENSPAFGTCTVKNPQAKVRGISDGDTNYMDDWNSNDWEVIGNIHDNPELLEVQNG